MPVHRVKQPVVANGLSMRLVSVPASAEFPSPAGDDLEDEIDPMTYVVRHPALISSTRTGCSKSFFSSLLSEPYGVPSTSAHDHPKT
jgi:hypothetical protein